MLALPLLAVRALVLAGSPLLAELDRAIRQAPEPKPSALIEEKLRLDKELREKHPEEYRRIVYARRSNARGAGRPQQRRPFPTPE